MMRRPVRLAPLALVALLAACHPIAGSAQKADNAVAWYHGRYNAGDFASIYRESDPDFRAGMAEEDFMRVMQSFTGKLGATGESRRTGVNVNVSTSGTRIIAAYQTDFAKASGVETFTFRVRGKEVRLVNYNINSRALLE